jgi:hypothetical protein
MSWCLVGSEMCIRDRARTAVAANLVNGFFNALPYLDNPIRLPMLPQRYGLSVTFLVAEQRVRGAVIDGKLSTDF